MVLSINPADFLKLMVGQRNRNHDIVADYLDSVASEVNELARIWKQVAQRLSQGETSVDLSTISPMIVPEMQSESFYRVRQFYDSVWLATEGVLDADRRESIVYQLGAMLQTRAMTLSQYRQYVENLRGKLLCRRSKPTGGF